MKQLIVAITIAAALLSRARAQSPEDTAGIRQAALDYIESWYEGNPERMQGALHPDLAKRIVRRNPNGESQLDHMTASTLVENVRKGGGKLKVLSVWQPAPIAPSGSQPPWVYVEAELTPEAQGPYTLRLWAEGGSRAVILRGVPLP